MTRREFLETLGLSASVVTFGISTTDRTSPETQAPIDGSSLVVENEHCLQVGDVFTIDSPARYAINPKTMKSTGCLQQFIVTSVAPGIIGVFPHVRGEVRKGSGVYFWPRGYGWKPERATRTT